MFFHTLLIYQNVINELSFLLVTQMTYFYIWFGRYGILKSGFKAREIIFEIIKLI
jgi:hypothetical protein